MRAFGAVATVASLATIAFGAEVERYQVHRPTLPLTSISKPGVAGCRNPASTGSTMQRRDR
jgi:hypothetical protein